jgi:hypothetical protein
MYAIIDGNHRLASLLRLAVDAKYPQFTFNTEINLVPHSSDASVELCRAVSSLLNEDHYMGRTATFIDSLSYMYDTIQHLTDAGHRNLNINKLQQELEAAGVTVCAKMRSTEEDHNQSSGIPLKHLKVYWAWVQILDDDDIARLRELQDIDAEALYKHLQGDGVPGPHDSREQDSSIHQSCAYPDMPDGELKWIGKVGDFLPKLSRYRPVPSHANKILTRDTTGRQAVHIIERGWVRWVLGGGRFNSLDLWKALSHGFYDQYEKGTLEHMHYTQMIADETQTVEDLLFIRDLIEDVPGLDSVSLTQQYDLMQFFAIFAARNELSIRINDWHRAHPKSDAGTSGLTITGMTSRRSMIVDSKPERMAIGNWVELYEVRENYKKSCDVLREHSMEGGDEKLLGFEKDEQAKWIARVSKKLKYVHTIRSYTLAYRPSTTFTYTPLLPQVRVGQGLRSRLCR